MSAQTASAILPLPDAEIVRRVAAGDHAAFTELMRRHNRLLYRTARALRLLESKVDCLLDAFRMVFMLRGLEEMSVEEAAVALGIPKPRCARATSARRAWCARRWRAKSTPPSTTRSGSTASAATEWWPRSWLYFPRKRFASTISSLKLNTAACAGSTVMRTQCASGKP